MYNLHEVKRRIMEVGLENVIKEMNSISFSPEEKKSLTEANILVGGYPNLALLSKIAEEIDFAQFIMSRNPSVSYKF